MRTIDAHALSGKAEEMYIHTSSGKVIPVMAVPAWAINNAPTIEAEPVVRSNWEYHCVGRFPSAPYHDIMRCPVCSYTHPKLTGYSYKRCMECGAIMDGGAEE